MMVIRSYRLPSLRFLRHYAYAKLMDNPHRFHFRIQDNPGCGHYLVPSGAMTAFGAKPSQCLGRGGCQSSIRLINSAREWAAILSARLESLGG